MLRCNNSAKINFGGLQRADANEYEKYEEKQEDDEKGCVQISRQSYPFYHNYDCALALCPRRSPGNRIL